jgi:hypothetical protein
MGGGWGQAGGKEAAAFKKAAQNFLLICAMGVVADKAHAPN